MTTMSTLTPTTGITVETALGQLVPAIESEQNDPNLCTMLVMLQKENEAARNFELQHLAHHPAIDEGDDTMDTLNLDAQKCSDGSVEYLASMQLTNRLPVYGVFFTDSWQANNYIPSKSSDSPEKAVDTESQATLGNSSSEPLSGVKQNHVERIVSQPIEPKLATWLIVPNCPMELTKSVQSISRRKLNLITLQLLSCATNLLCVLGRVLERTGKFSTQTLQLACRQRVNNGIVDNNQHPHHYNNHLLSQNGGHPQAQLVYIIMQVMTGLKVLGLKISGALQFTDIPASMDRDHILNCKMMTCTSGVSDNYLVLVQCFVLELNSRKYMSENPLWCWFHFGHIFLANKLAELFSVAQLFALETIQEWYPDLTWILTTPPKSIGEEESDGDGGAEDDQDSDNQGLEDQD
ncbi:hypothetical protein L218DRAFT_951640 [Marasmius fiardii PR-910]|nr:hypothetical protein L218DRAFT_951640 [Marasmius fiardii PR-910]